jgi:hypothetical protein
VSAKPKEIKRISQKKLEDANGLIEYFISTGQKFSVEISNYTISVKCEALNMRFITEERSKKTFLAYQRLKRDVLSSKIPKIASEQLQYFHHNFTQSANYNKVINIDLKNCYASMLFRRGVISAKSYKLLCDLDKQERLASVGMLAAKKYVFDYDNGEIVKTRQDISPYENFFYFAVKETQSLMRRLRLIAGEEYLFTWVDGIYIKNDKIVYKLLTAYLKQFQINYSIDILSDFDLNIDDKGKVNLSFYKDRELKVFGIPPMSNEFSAYVADYLLKKHSKYGQSSKINRTAIVGK